MKGRYFIIILGVLTTVSVPKPINKLIAIFKNVIVPIVKFTLREIKKVYIDNNLPSNLYRYFKISRNVKKY